MNRSKSAIIYLLLFIGCLFSSRLANAQHFDMKAREWSSIKSGALVKSCFQSPPVPPATPCDTLLCQVDFFNNPGLVNTNFKVKEVRSFVKLHINHNDVNVHAPYSYMLSYEVKGYKNLNSTTATDIIRDTLMVSYMPDSTHAYQDIHMRSYYGYYRVELKVLDVYDYTAVYNAMLAGTTPVPTPVPLLTQGATAPVLTGMKTNWSIELGMAEQKFDLALSTGNPSAVYSADMANSRLIATHTPPAGSSNILKISWDLSTTEKPNPAMYELEWMYVDNYAVSVNNATGVLTVAEKTPLNYDFTTNSSRIITNKTSYELPVVYKRGYIVYRARLLRPDDGQYRYTKYGPWSNGNDKGTVGSGNGFYRINTAHLGDQSNWNYEASYAEEGKSKQVLGYYDGLLKSRQSLTRFSSRPNELIGAEKFYDHEGRVGLQTLPVPVAPQLPPGQLPALSYIPGFALSGTTQQPYTAADIDPLIPAGGSISLLPGLHTTSAASNYYSPQNSLLGMPGYSMIKSLPDAEGFPLQQTHYLPDDPGRPRVQGSVGKELQLGKGHETGYYYQPPDQGELNEYFGVNIGKASFYEKIITRDPNKEQSFSVLNNKGKPVMTGLMGFPDVANNTTLLNLDGVTIPGGPFPFSKLLYGNPPTWSGHTRTFNKTIFREGSGGALNFGLTLPPYQPCASKDYWLSVPLEYSVGYQGEHDATATSVIASTTVVPNGGSSSGPYIAGNGSSNIMHTQNGLSLNAMNGGENTIVYKATYNPDHVDSAIRRYLRLPALYNSTPTCFVGPDYFMKEEIGKLPEYCDESDEDDERSGSECGQYEGIMRMQLMPMATYGSFNRMGAAGNIVVGNGRSLFAIVGWTPKDPTDTRFAPIYQVPQPGSENLFEPTCYGTGVILSGSLDNRLDQLSEFYTPLYAYQQILPGFTVTTNYNGAAVTLDAATAVDYLLDVFNDDVAQALLSLHPEYCTYINRYCDASEFIPELQSIPSFEVATQLQRATPDQLIAADPFVQPYINNPVVAGVADDLKYMAYKIVDANGAITGSREVAIDYFAYHKVKADAAPDVAAYWALYLPNSTGARVSAGINLSDLSPQQKDAYYELFKSLYIAARGDKIARFRNLSGCNPTLPFTDNAKTVFKDDLNTNGNPNSPGPPSYEDIVNGNFTTNIQNVRTGTNTPGNVLNDLDAYAEQIVKQLLNCREISNVNYNSVLFTGLLADIKTKISSSIALGLDKVWKGGITPYQLKEILLSRNIQLDDLCNPYLVDYTLSAASVAAPCGPAPTVNYCNVISQLDLEHSVLKSPPFDFLDGYIVNPGPPISGTKTVVTDPTNLFDRLLMSSLGYSISAPVPLTYSWTTNGNFGLLEFKFTNGAREVAIDMSVSTINSLRAYYLVQQPNGTLTPLSGSLPSVYQQALTPFNGSAATLTDGNLVNYMCYDALSDKNMLKLFLMHVNKKNFVSGGNSYDAIIGEAYMDIKGLELDYFFGKAKGDASLPCINTCIACNELKAAYEVYQQEVAVPYGIKGKGHPYYETSLRSFFNYYFRNRHYADEYLNFMQGCNLSDRLFLPQYYGYFQASGNAGAIDHILAAIRGYSAVSPATAPLAGPEPSLAARLENLQYFQYQDAGGTNHLYVDFNSVFKNERLRPFILYMKNWLATNAGGASWSFNQLNSEVPGQPAYSADIFLQGTGTALPNSMGNLGVTVTSENVTVKDVASPGGTPVLQMPFTHYRFSSPLGATTDGLASAFGQLNNEAKLALQAASRNDQFIELTSHESYRNTHGNSVGDKTAYLQYVYGLAPGTDHDQLLQLLSASNLQSTVYSSAGNVLKDVSYRQPLGGDINEPSGTLQLSIPNTTPATTSGFTLLNNMLEQSKASHISYTFPGSPAPVVAPGTPFVYSFPGFQFTPNSGLANLAYAGHNYTMSKLRRISGNTYAFLLTANVTNVRNHNVYLRVPEYISKLRAISYNLVHIEPLVYGNSKRYFKALFQQPGNAAATFEAIGKTDFDLVTNVPDQYSHLMLCDAGEDAEADSIDICYDRLIEFAINNAGIRNSQYQDSLYNSLRFVYRNHIETKIDDELEVSLPKMKAAVTLYNYDRAGNLMSTVPPMGVQPISNTSAVDGYREGTQPNPVLPAHTKTTEYRYGAQNQLLSETTPDAGLTIHVYDVAGRLLFSQNSRQQAKEECTYMLYDAQNRVTETGQIQLSTSAALLRDYFNHLKSLQYDQAPAGMDYVRGLLHNTRREQVVRTTYDTELYTLATTDNGLSRQENLRSRVAAVASYPVLAVAATGYTGYDVALHYSYDLSGNVKTLTYDMPLLQSERQRYKRIDYDYDLYSGKVSLVSYNRSFADQYYQRYAYDDDNRITEVETSKDGIIWDRDAAYKYYPHGPLARISLGDQRVQGIDFAYTLQGWLKSINGDSPGSVNDMGGDGVGVNAHQPDLYRTSLSYFEGDYKPLDATDAAHTTGSKLLKLPEPAAANRSLYNGNIAASSNLPGYLPPLHTAYRYDKLNRIKEANYEFPDYTAASPVGTGANPYGITGGVANLYHSDYSYDLDGNLKTLNRYGFKNGVSGTHYAGQVYRMDQLDYKYISGTTVNNRLTNFTDIADHATATGFTNDLANYNEPDAGNKLRLEYDASGNLVKDKSNGLSSIGWNLYGKTQEVVKEDGRTLLFKYDPLGNRLSKTVRTNIVPGSGRNEVTEYYIRDAGGNLLSTYRQQLRYRQERVLEIAVATLRNVPGFSTGLGSILGNDGGFASALVTGVYDTEPAYAENEVGAHDIAYYVDRNTSACVALADRSPGMLSTLSADETFRNQLVPPDVYYEPLFEPLSKGITEKDSLRPFVLKMLESPLLVARCIEYASLDPNTPVNDIADLFVDALFDWQNAHTASEQLHGLIWRTAGPQDIYAEVAALLLTDEAYLQSSVGHDEEGNYPSLESQLKVMLYAKLDAPTASDMRSKLNTYLANEHAGLEGMEILRGTVGIANLLGTVYAEAPVPFIENVLAAPQMTNALVNALGSASGMSALNIVTQLGNYNEVMQIPLTQVIDYNQLYLSEQVLYGSSRLGIKNYWPTQYRYEYDLLKTTAENNASLDSSAFAHRTAWYAHAYGSLIKNSALLPWGQSNTDPVYSSRVVGQKRYELSNHLGNVMAVVSDKVTETRVDDHAPLPSLAVKRAGLSAAYDYYPFGMLMPERMVEDASVHCIPLSRTRMVKTVVRDVPSTGGPMMPSFLSLAVAPEGGNVHFEEGEGILTVSNPNGALNWLIPLPAPQPGAQGIQVELNLNSYSDNYMHVQLEQLGLSEDTPAVILNQQQVAGMGQVSLAADLPSAGSGSYGLRVIGFSHELSLSDGFYDMITLQAQTYVTLSCDTDGRFDDSYRFGFNGQMKDNEIAGVGNSLDFGARMYDSRLGRWTAVDPKKNKYPDHSPYSYGLNSPILFKDIEGKWITDENGIPIYTSGGHKYVKSIDGKIMYLIQVRYYYTNDGQKIYVEKYKSMLTAENYNKAYNKEVDIDDVSEPVPEAYKYDCHANSTFPNQNLYLPGFYEKDSKENASKIFYNTAEYAPISAENAREGDIAVFIDENGDISHSATLNKNGNFTTKDDRAEIRYDISRKDIESQWGKFKGYYRSKGNMNSGVQSEAGKVSEETAKQAIENVKDINKKGKTE